MTSTAKEVIRDIKLYELGIKDKIGGYDELMNLRGLDSFKTEDPNEHIMVEQMILNSNIIKVVMDVFP